MKLLQVSHAHDPLKFQCTLYLTCSVWAISVCRGDSCSIICKLSQSEPRCPSVLPIVAVYMQILLQCLYSTFASIVCLRVIGCGEPEACVELEIDLLSEYVELVVDFDFDFDFFLIHYSRAEYTYGEAMGRALRPRARPK